MYKVTWTDLETGVSHSIDEAYDFGVWSVDTVTERVRDTLAFQERDFTEEDLDEIQRNVGAHLENECDFPDGENLDGIIREEIKDYFGE